MDQDQRKVKEAAENLVKGLKEGELSERLTEDLSTVTQNVLNNSMLPKDMLGVSDQMMEGFYGQAYRLYQTGKFREAAQLFRLLIMGNATEPKYALGLAACFHLMKEYKNAAEAYAVCAMMDPKSPIPHFHSSDCYLQMKDSLSAIVALEMAIQNAGNRPEFKGLKDKALLTLEGLKKENTLKAT